MKIKDNTINSATFNDLNINKSSNFGNSATLLNGIQSFKINNNNSEEVLPTIERKNNSNKAMTGSEFFSINIGKINEYEHKKKEFNKSTNKKFIIKGIKEI